MCCQKKKLINGPLACLTTNTAHRQGTLHSPPRKKLSSSSSGVVRFVLEIALKKTGENRERGKKKKKTIFFCARRKIVDCGREENGAISKKKERKKKKTGRYTYRSMLSPFFVSSFSLPKKIASVFYLSPPSCKRQSLSKAKKKQPFIQGTVVGNKRLLENS